MKKVLLDSSVWVSFFADDQFSLDAERIVNASFAVKSKIIVPSIVYFEVLNVLGRLGNMFQEKALKAFYGLENIKINYPNKNFWHESIEKYSSKIRLKSLDLLIIGFALDLGVDEFYSFDIKQLNAYYILKSYEEFS